MSGGVFTRTNKIRPGAYINFKSIPRPVIMLGNRGIAAIPLALTWGNDNSVIDVFSDELADGRSLAKIGFTAFETESKLLAVMLSNCYLAKVFKLNSGGEKAAAGIGNLTATAKYPGTFGNKLSVRITANGNLFNVFTFVNGSERDCQTVSVISELESNDWIDFGGAGVLEINGGTPLSGGTDGIVNPNAYAECMNALRTERWQALAIPVEDVNTKQAALTFIEEIRSNGRYSQVVLEKFNVANFEGVISVENSCAISGVEFTTAEFTAWVAGATAGAASNIALTGRVVQGAERIINTLSVAEIEEGLRLGKFMLSANQNGQVKVEQDINSLHTFTAEKSYVFSKNRVLRVFDEVGIAITDIWETQFLGRVGNDDNGRALFRGAVIGLFDALQNNNAIQNFSGSGDVTVTQGETIDSVVCTVGVWPVDSMEKLFMTVVVYS
jgi:hypothetical protein